MRSHGGVVVLHPQAGEKTRRKEADVLNVVARYVSSRHARTIMTQVKKNDASGVVYV
jgi:hypothetical protein